MTPSTYRYPMAKHLVALDEEALAAARAELGTFGAEDTVNEALRRAASTRRERVARAMHVLAGAGLTGRADGWR